MYKLVNLVLFCCTLLACSGSVVIVSEKASFGTTTSSGTTPTQPPDGDGGSGDAGGGDVVGGVGGEGGSVSDGGTSEGGSPPGDCSTNALSVKLDSNTPQSAIVIGGSDWIEVARYVVSNAMDEEIKISFAQVAQLDPNGDIADFTEAALSSKYAIFLTGSTVSEDGASLVLTEEKNGGLIIPPKSSKSVELSAKFAPVLSSSAAGDKWHGVPRSGHTPVLSFERYRIEGEAAEASHKTCASKPSTMVLRKSKPIVEKLALQSNVLANADIDLFKFQIKPDNAGPIAVRQIKMEHSKTEGLEITNLKIRRGSLDFDEASAWVWTPNGIDFYSQTSKPIFLVFKDEEVVSGPGNVYIIRGNVKGATTGQAITFSFVSELNPLSFTGYSCFCLYNSSFEHLSEYPPDPGNICSNLGSPPNETSIWSDMSEVPHGFASKDWTHGALLGLSGSETLSL